jgi:predicted lipoprotein with Yx(FWY)xxD motif
VPPIQDPPKATGPREASRKLPHLATLTASLLLTGVAALFASLALANVTPTLSASHNSALNKTIVVDARGRTLYALSPETVHHLLCRSHACLEIWRPVTVRSRAAGLRAARGVEGHLALLKRSDGKLQVTLRGLPLYRFSGDSANGQANGDGIKSFGGRWHVVPAKPAQAPPTAMSAPSPPSPGYGY